MSRCVLPKGWVGGAGILVIVLLQVVTELPVATTHGAPSSESFPRRKLGRIHRQLSRINKPAVKTIQTNQVYCRDEVLLLTGPVKGQSTGDQPYQSADGDFIDCVKSTQQPAFDHPALLNHSLEIPPDHRPADIVDAKPANNNNSSTGFLDVQLWHQNGQCPEGTVAIRRTLLKDVLRAGNLDGYKRKKNGLESVPQPHRPQAMSDNGHEHAISYMQGGLYYGAQSTMNVWSPSVQVPSEFSLSQMWILAGAFNSDLNSIEAGWQVSPQLYGDNSPRLFTYWTTDAYQATGCYNLLCSGFVQTSNAIAIGAAITPVSSSAGSQYDIRILIWKDPIKGNWWMQFGDGHLVGYWPASLFTHLATSATMLEWGGEVVNTQPGGHHSATTMGSGQFAEKGFAQASYVRNIMYVDAKNVLRTPVGMQTLAEHPKCYNIQSSFNREWGAYFYYGGPGQNSDCP